MNVFKNILVAAVAVTATAAFAPVFARDAAPSTPAAPTCCSGGSCGLPSGSCCDDAGCCKTDRSCCDPETGACTGACGCPAGNCCGGSAIKKSAAAKSRGRFVTEGKRTFWVPGGKAATAAAPAKLSTPSCCAPKK